MFDYLEQLRRRPEHERRRFMLIVIGIVMLCLVSVWFFNLRTTIGLKVKTRERYGASPVADLKDSFAGIGAAIKDLVPAFK